jgi:tRNA(Arg) A34 adenosine deaminase TadA
MMGVAVNDGIVSGRDKDSQDIVLKQFNTITIENSMKAERINPKPGVFNYEPADAFIEFGKKNNMFIVGHTLVWHNQTPAWFFQNEDGKLKTKEEVIHAEANAIGKLARDGEAGLNSTMFCTHAPCIDCAKLIYSAGITKVYYRNSYRDTKGIDFLETTGVRTEIVLD